MFSLFFCLLFCCIFYFLPSTGCKVLTNWGNPVEGLEYTPILAPSVSMKEEPTDRRLTGRPTDRPAGQPTDRPTDRRFHPFGKFVAALTTCKSMEIHANLWKSERPTDRPTDRRLHPFGKKSGEVNLFSGVHSMGPLSIRLGWHSSWRFLS